MSESRDMDAPVTRRELYDTLDTWGGTFTARVAQAIEQAIGASERRVLGAVKMLIEESEHRLLRELRASIKASEDELAARLVVVDEQYKGLPARVTKLEAKVFAPPKRRRRES